MLVFYLLLIYFSVNDVSTNDCDVLSESLKRIYL